MSHLVIDQGAPPLIASHIVTFIDRMAMGAAHCPTPRQNMRTTSMTLCVYGFFFGFEFMSREHRNETNQQIEKEECTHSTHNKTQRTEENKKKPATRKLSDRSPTKHRIRTCTRYINRALRSPFCTRVVYGILCELAFPSARPIR